MMDNHLTDGELRSLLDGEAELKRSQHLIGCQYCQIRLDEMQSKNKEIARTLSFLAGADTTIPPTNYAWDRFNNRVNMKKENFMFRRWFTIPTVRFGTAIVLILALVLAFPQTRALADQLLNLFRVQQVTVIPVDFTGLKQLTGNDALGNQLSELISSSTVMTKKPGEPRNASDATQGSQLAGFNVRLPKGQTPSRISISGPAAFTFTVDRTKAQALLNEAGRSDLILPESLEGAKILVDIPASASVAFGNCPQPHPDARGEKVQIPGRQYSDCVILAEIPSPSVNAPADVDVEQLAQIGLEFTGMSHEQAAAYTSTVDWKSTLVIPIPKNAATYKQVNVDGVTGTLIQRPADDAPQYALIWLKDGIVYTISGLGANSQQAIDMAKALP